MAIELQIEAPSSFRIICKSLELRYPYKQLIRWSQIRLWGKKIPSVSGEFSHNSLITLFARICYLDIPWVSFTSFSHFLITAQAERQMACKSKPLPIWLQKELPLFRGALWEKYIREQNSPIRALAMSYSILHCAYMGPTSTACLCRWRIPRLSTLPRGASGLLWLCLIFPCPSCFISVTKKQSAPCVYLLHIHRRKNKDL